MERMKGFRVCRVMEIKNYKSRITIIITTHLSDKCVRKLEYAVLTHIEEFLRQQSTCISHDTAY